MAATTPAASGGGGAGFIMAPGSAGSGTNGGFGGGIVNPVVAGLGGNGGNGTTGLGVGRLTGDGGSGGGGGAGGQLGGAGGDFGFGGSPSSTDGGGGGGIGGGGGGGQDGAGGGGFGGGGGGAISSQGGQGGFGGGGGSGGLDNNSSFAGGSASGGMGGGGAGLGGAIFNMGLDSSDSNSGILNLTNSTLSGNRAQGGDGAEGGDGLGGGIFNLTGHVSLTYATLSGDLIASGGGVAGGTAFSAGAEVYNLSAYHDIPTGNGNVKAQNTLINSVLGSGGVAMFNNSNVTATLDQQIVIDGETSLVDDFKTSSFGTPTLVGTPIIPGSVGNPGLGTLGDHGGLTQTVPPLEPDPAIGGLPSTTIRAATPLGSITTDQRGMPRDPVHPTIGAFEPQSVVVTASNVAIPFVPAGQQATLTAHVTDTLAPGVVPAEGKVTFTVKDQSGKTVGSVSVGSVDVTGTATVHYPLPALALGGKFTIGVSYIDSGPANFVDAGDVSGTLSVTSDLVRVTETDNQVFSETAPPHSLTLSATATSAAGVVNEGNITFTLKDSSGNVIGTPVTGPVSAGAASVTYPLSTPLGTDVYTVAVSYSSAGTFTDDGTDTSGTITVTGTPVITTAGSVSALAANGPRTFNLSATLSGAPSPVNEGTVTFKVFNGSAVIAQASAMVTNSSAAVAVNFPSGLGIGSYPIHVSYLDKGGIYSDGGDTAGVLAITLPPTVTQAFDVITTPSAASQSINVSAIVQVPATGALVNEGSLTFTLLLGPGQTVEGSAPVANGGATVNLMLPAGLAAGSYALDAAYLPGPDFLPSGDNSHAVIVQAPTPPVAATTSTSKTVGFTPVGSLFGTVVQTTNADHSPGPGLFLSAFVFPFPFITGVTLNGTGFDVHIAGLFSGLFPISLDVFFDASGNLISFSIP
jgi:hypothetical protein